MTQLRINPALLRAEVDAMLARLDYSDPVRRQHQIDEWLTGAAGLYEHLPPRHQEEARVAILAEVTRGMHRRMAAQGAQSVAGEPYRQTAPLGPSQHNGAPVWLWRVLGLACGAVILLLVMARNG